MKNIRFAAYLVLSLFPIASFSLSINNYRKKPKLVVVLVIDQFRSDLLTELALDKKSKGGLTLLTEQGAWFPFAEYGSIQDMTCPGHATILTGAHPATHGIGTNEWYDPIKNKLVYCAEDNVDGISPRRLKTSTVGDELKMYSPSSRVFAIALKDRSAVMLGGKNPDAAFWFSPTTFTWTTSKYYNAGKIPDWLIKANELYEKTKPNFDAETVDGAKGATEATLKIATEILKNEKLGQKNETDILAISLSSHDILGHTFGPNSDEIKKFTEIENTLIEQFVQELKSHVGLDKVLIALTADHGTPPSVEITSANKIDSGRFDMEAYQSALNDHLNKKFSSFGKKENWFKASRYRHYFFDQKILQKRKLTFAQVEQEVKTFSSTFEGIHLVFTRSDYNAGQFPQGKIGKFLKQSFSASQSGDFVLILKPFYYEKGRNKVTHTSGWSYDRSVPIIFFGTNIKSGVYADAEVVDIAPTISHLLGILPPAMSEGRVLKEIIK